MFATRAFQYQIPGESLQPSSKFLRAVTGLTQLDSCFPHLWFPLGLRRGHDPSIAGSLSHEKLPRRAANSIHCKDPATPFSLRVPPLEGPFHSRSNEAASSPPTRSPRVPLAAHQRILLPRRFIIRCLLFLCRTESTGRQACQHALVEASAQTHTGLPGNGRPSLIPTIQTVGACQSHGQY